ncbi:transcription factor HES-1-like [Acanthaster planci]|uniref:Transcription factor HES-1-like n=1 Tax=Acanthaster planci TaxID=133434 RepID=A0A8B7ZF47_ACAPL|nr:transcription factor HES-1-like [Acanthaster planci]
MAGDRTSKSQEKRKSSKPLMEKRRRARINECLAELQGILEAANSGQEETPGSHSKREKAEILEQTVQLVKHLRHQGQTGIPNDPIPQAQYRAGFSECMSEVSRFMEANKSALKPETRSGLLNHLAGSLVPCSGTGWGGTAPFAAGVSRVAPREVGVNLSRPGLERPAGAPASTSVPVHSHTLATPPKVIVPPLAPAQQPTAPSISSQQAVTSNTNNAIPVEQSPRKGEHPTAACIPPLTPATPGVTLPVNFPPAPAGHVALVLPAHLLSSFVGGQFATGQVIPLYHQQSGSPVMGQQRAVTARAPAVLPAGSVGEVLSNPNPGQSSNFDNQCAPSSGTGGAGPIFVIPGLSSGCSSNVASTSARPKASSTPSQPTGHALRGGIPVPASNQPTTPGNVVTMETRSQNGVVYAPASLPMQLFVAPSAYSGGVNAPFANGLSLPNPSAFALGPHWRPWGWDQDQS